MTPFITLEEGKRMKTESMNKMLKRLLAGFLTMVLLFQYLPKKIEASENAATVPTIGFKTNLAKQMKIDGEYASSYTNSQTTNGGWKDYKEFTNIQGSDSDNYVYSAEINFEKLWPIIKNGVVVEEGTSGATNMTRSGIRLDFATADVTITDTNEGTDTKTAVLQAEFWKNKSESKVYASVWVNWDGNRYADGLGTTLRRLSHVESTTIEFKEGKDYTLTVRKTTNDNKEYVSFWVDDTCLCENVNLSDTFTRVVSGATTHTYQLSNITRYIGVSYAKCYGTVSDVVVFQDTPLVETKAPTIGSNTNEAEKATNIPTEFNTSDKREQYLEIGKATVTDENGTWYYSGVFNYSSLRNGETGGVTVIFGEGTYNDTICDLSVTSRPVKDMNTGKVKGSQNVIWAGSKGLKTGSGSILYEIGKDYRFTVEVSQGKFLTYWIDDTIIFEDMNLEELAHEKDGTLTDMKLKFGIFSDGTKGTLKDIQIWGDILIPEKEKAPLIGDNANLAEEAEALPDGFSKNNQYLDNANIRISGNTWYYSGVFSYTNLGNYQYGGVNVLFGEGFYDNGEESGTFELSVTARPKRNSELTTVVGCQNLIRVGFPKDNQGAVVNVASNLLFEKDTDYRFTVRIREGNYLSYWIDDILIFEDVDLSSKGITNITPKFGIFADGTVGTLKDIQIWDGITKTFKPVYDDSVNNNEATLNTVKTTCSDGTRDAMFYDGLTYNTKYYYTGVVRNLDNLTEEQGSVGFIVGTAKYNGAEACVEVECLSDATKAFLKICTDTEKITLAEADIIGMDSSLKGSKYTVKYRDNVVSFWIDEILLFKEINLAAVNGLTEMLPKAGVVSEKCKATVSDIRIWGAVTATEKSFYQKFNDVSVYRTAVGNTYPNSSKFVFGGWYASADGKVPLGTDVISGSAYAKFVPAGGLSINQQVTKNTKADSKNTNLRLITTVDSLMYKEIYFDVTIGGVKRSFSDVRVYKNITVRANENKISYKPTSFCKPSRYYYTFSIMNIDQSTFDDEIMITPCWLTLDGTRVTGLTRTLKIQDLLK